MLSFNKWFWSKAFIYILDLLFANLGFVCFFWTEQQCLGIQLHPTALKYLLVANVAYVVTLVIYPSAVYYRIKKSELIVKQAFKFVLQHLVMFYAGTAIFNLAPIPFLHALLFYSLFLTGILLYRYLLWKGISHLRIQGKNNKRIVLVGDLDCIRKLVRVMDEMLVGYSVVGVFSDDENLSPEALHGLRLKKVGCLNELESFCREMTVNENRIDEIYCGMPFESFGDFSKILDFCENNMIRFFFVPTQYNYVSHNLRSEHLANMLILSVREEPLQEMGNVVIKRLFDVFFSLLFLVFFYPFIFIIIGVLIKLSSKGPVYFIQKRTGMNGKVFNCIKFRSMIENEQCDEAFATRDDPRKTKIGAWLRKTNLDELPQFINVLKGDMSIVGPRPHMLKHTDMYASMVNRYAVRLLVKPGITGLAQCKGYRGEVSKLEDIQQRVKWDIWYLENWSLLLDIKIIFITLWNMIKGDENAY